MTLDLTNSVNYSNCNFRNKIRDNFEHDDYFSLLSAEDSIDDLDHESKVTPNSMSKNCIKGQKTK